MRNLKYTNMILTANALLLSALVWTLWNQPALGPGLGAAHAAQPDEVDGIPNAGTQRQHMIDILRRMEAKTEATNRLLSGGRLKVEVTNLDEIQVRADSRRERDSE